MNARKLTCLILLLTTSFLFCDEANALDFSSSYSSRFLWHGYDLGPHLLRHGVKIDGPGLNFEGAWLRPMEDVDSLERFDLNVGFTWEIGDIYVRPGFEWLLYGERDADDGFDVQAATMRVGHEIGLYYDFMHLWPTNGSSSVESGQLHILGLTREIGPVELFGTVTYSDDFVPFGRAPVDDFTHSILGVALNLGSETIIFRPAYYRQFGLNDALSDEEVWSLALIARY